MSRSPAHRWRVSLVLAVLAALAVTAAAVAATARHSAGSTLVIDNSFTIKTTDPQRAFDPTGSIIDRGLYDTLFTYNGSDLAHPVPLLVTSFQASEQREDVHLQSPKKTSTSPTATR